MASGQARPLAECIRTVHRLVDPAIEPRLGAVPYDPRQVMRLEVDIRRLKQDTGFEPRWSFEDGIAAILAYKNPQIC